MKEFNLKRAMRGVPLCTRCGDKVEILKWNKKTPQGIYPIVGLRTNSDGCEVVEDWRSDGRYAGDNQHAYDLMLCENADFNLEDAKAGMKVQTRDGRPVRLLCFDRKWTNSNFCIIGLVPDEDGDEQIEEWLPDGSYYDDDIKDENDLVMC